MADWQVTYNGKLLLVDLEISTEQPRSDLSETILAASKEIRKGKHGHEAITLHTTPFALEGSGSTTPFYQPIGKIIFVLSHQDGSLKKAHLVSFVSVDEDCRVGGPSPRFYCHTFKCRNEEEANNLSFAVNRTMAGAAQHQPKIKQSLSELTANQVEGRVKSWNAGTARMFHFGVGKDQTIAGVIKVLHQVDKSLKTVTKLVRLSNLVTGEELLKLLAEKFNLGEVNLSEYAVFAVMDTGEQHMLDEDGSPISMSLSWDDSSEGTFWLRKLPPGLVRLSAPRKSEGTVVQELTAAPSAGNKVEGLSKIDTVAPNTSASTEGSTAAGGELQFHAEGSSGLGPLLPYHQDDEDLLLSVMITRQSGTGLGFKLTPAYLLQMCVAYCALHRGDEALALLLQKIATQIGTVVADNPANAEMLLFWASNAMKLTATLVKDERTATVYRAAIEPTLSNTIEVALKNIRICAAGGEVQLPEALAKEEWSTLAQLRTVVQNHYTSLDANMSYENLLDVVQRITAAMPSPLTKSNSQRTVNKRNESVATVQTAPAGRISNGGLVLQDGLSLQASSGTDADADGDADSESIPFTSTPANGKASTPSDASILGASAIPHDETTVAGDQRGVQQHLEPLSDEWEELVDQETKHRFFANHLTRQTSWTDPRDTLRTVQLTKGDTGLGLGISGAKRTRDDRLVLGIFVSSLVAESAAALEGTLREGDEILEVNGHSLIGVSREGAIEFLKQVKFGNTVTLLVSQEPDYMRKSQLRHTAL